MVTDDGIVLRDGENELDDQAAGEDEGNPQEPDGTDGTDGGGV